MSEPHRDIWPTKLYEVGPNKKLIEAVSGVVGASAYHIDAEGYNVRGDANANGTVIATLTIPAYNYFLCTEFLGTCNLAGVLWAGVGALATPPTDYDWIDLPNRGLHGKQAEVSSPLFVVDNSAGATALTLNVYAPQIAVEALATNNDLNHYYYAKIGGLNIPAP